MDQVKVTDESVTKHKVILNLARACRQGSYVYNPPGRQYEYGLRDEGPKAIMKYAIKEIIRISRLERDRERGESPRALPGVYREFMIGTTSRHVPTYQISRNR